MGGDTLPPSRNPEGEWEIKGVFGGGQFAPKNSGKFFIVSGSGPVVIVRLWFLRKIPEKFLSFQEGGPYFPQVSFVEKIPEKFLKIS